MTNEYEEQPKLILKVRFYKTANGRESVREWLKSLPKEIKKIIGDDIKTVQQGWPIGMPLVRHMGNRLLEVRSTIPNGIARVLFVVHDLTMFLLHGFIKKSPKTPALDLEKGQ